MGREGRGRRGQNKGKLWEEEKIDQRAAMIKARELYQ